MKQARPVRDGRRSARQLPGDQLRRKITDELERHAAELSAPGDRRRRRSAPTLPGWELRCQPRGWNWRWIDASREVST